MSLLWLQGESEGKMTWDEVLDEIEIFIYCKDDWDSEGSPAPTKTTITNAMGVVEIYRKDEQRPPDRVMLSVNGSIYFEYYGYHGYCEIEISDDDIKIRAINHANYSI